MTTEKIKELYQARPFKAFTLYLADGSIVPVKSPEFMWMTPGGRTMFVSQGGEATDIIDILMVTKVSVANGASQPRRRRPRSA
jgi:hypothetical protein